MALHRGIICLPADSELVSDADDEVFFLYTNLQHSPAEDSLSDSFRGLGHVNSRKDTLSITFELKSPAPESDPFVKQSKKRRQGRDKTLEVELAQDKTALRSRKGDTGSVLWSASVEFAQAILQQQYSRLEDSLLDLNALADAHVLELGAGTGLLGIVLSPLVQRYTLTDIPDLLPLIRKNLALNFNGWPALKPGIPGSNVEAEALDWLQIHGTPLPSRARLFPLATAPLDLILVVDCVYNPSLLPALVETIDFHATPGKTAVLVIVELRQEDVVREFLELWIMKGGWEIRRVGSGFLGMRYAVWMGWKECQTKAGHGKCCSPSQTESSTERGGE